MALHKPSECVGHFCPLHNPSEHRMSGWQTFTRVSGLVERLCPHGVGHPDPDSMAFLDPENKHMLGVHGCDGCCTSISLKTEKPYYPIKVVVR